MYQGMEFWSHLAARLGNFLSAIFLIFKSCSAKIGLTKDPPSTCLLDTRRQVLYPDHWQAKEQLLDFELPGLEARSLQFGHCFQCGLLPRTELILPENRLGFEVIPISDLILLKLHTTWSS